jgi:hypothetical protein
MPITPYLDDHEFDPETERVMGLAFEMACVALRLADRDDLINSIIERWKTGERNPDVLCEQAVKDIRRPGGPF